MNEKRTDAFLGANHELSDTIAAPVKKPGYQVGGLLERAVTRFLMRPACVTGITNLSENFRLIDFQSEALKQCTWSPGDKVQIKLDGGWITRTYTPIDWDRTKGTTRIVAYCHGDGPGSDWSRRVTVGDERQFFGPRASIALTDLGSTTVLFGDETSFGLALALQQLGEPGAVRHFVFEVNDRHESAATLHKLGLSNAVFVERLPGDAHLLDISDAVLAVAQRASTFVLTGKASSIQHVRRTLKANGFETRRLRTKVYWAPGKEGLD